MSWLSIRQCLSYVGLAKLARLTNESAEKALLGVGDGVIAAYTTPFFGGGTPKVYADGVEVTVGITLAQTGTGERWTVTFSTPATYSGKRLEALSIDGVNADVLDQKLTAAQAEIRGYVNASSRFSAPADNAAAVGEPLLRWSWDVAAYLLASDLRRAGLLEAYPGIADRYADLTGGGPGAQGRPASFQPVLRDVAKGQYDLSGVTGVTAKTGSMSATDPYITSSYGSEGDRVFGPPE